MSYSDPLGIEVGDLTDSNAVAEDQEVDASIFGNIKAKFTSGNAAFAYLIFILLYTPCVAAMGLMFVNLAISSHALLQFGQWR